ncbi:MAG: amidohydrolase [Elusimicrobia bacterium]|nr:amidohydrolase [Elusimicrobiota bacterium]
MKVLIKSADVLTLDSQDRVLRGCDVAVSGKDILAVGRIPRDFKPDEMIPGRNRLITPAFYNAHCHSPMALVRGWAEDLPFDRWLNEKIWVAESALREEDVHWGSALAACEMIRSGTVGFADHYFWMEQVAQVVESSGLKALLAWCLFGLGTDKEVGRATLQRTLGFARAHHMQADGRLRVALGPHSPYMCPDGFLSQVRDAAQRLQVGIHLHLSESDEQVQRSLARHGCSPVAHLDRLGLFDGPVPALAAHCISVSKDDLSILARKKVSVAHSPKTYMKLGMGMAPLQRLLGAGVHTALATDGPASNNDLNMLEVMRLAGLFQKNEQHKPEALPHTELLRLATSAGARAMGFPGAGVIAPGRRADLALFDTDQAHWVPRHDLGASVVYASHPGDITHVMCDGRWLMKDRRLVTLDEERIRREAETRALRLVGAPMRLVRRYRG